MALTSVFYDGPVTETDRAKSRTGAPDYGVYGADDFKVSTNGSVPFSTLLKAGRAHGWGVTDTAATDQTLVHDPVASGTRWDLVVVRRNWQPLLGGPSTLAIIKGGAFTDMPTRNIGPGVEDDQPIAMVGWKSGQTAPFQIIDLRCWASNGGLEIANEIAFEYLSTPGACVQFNGTTWRYSRSANGVWGWMDASGLDRIQAGSATIAIGPANTYRSAQVNFPASFSTVPKVNITMTFNPGYPATRLNWAAINKTASKFDLKVYTDDGKPIGGSYSLGFDWIAVTP